MKIKELFELLDKHNAFNRLYEEKEDILHIYINSYGGCEFKTYKNFVRWLKKEYVPSAVKAILDQDFQRKGQCQCSYFSFMGYDYEIQIYPTREPYYFEEQL